MYFLQPSRGGFTVHSRFNPQNWIPVQLTSMHTEKTPAPIIKAESNKTQSLSMRQLPSFSLSGNNDTDEEKSFIILDWPVDDKLFTHDNYIALESLLVNFPDSKFRWAVFRIWKLHCLFHLYSYFCRILIPTSRDAYLHKIGNLFSTAQFRKYSKLGYDIEVVPVGQMEQSRGPGYGTDYWERWMPHCCKDCDDHCR